MSIFGSKAKAPDAPGLTSMPSPADWPVRDTDLTHRPDIGLWDYVVKQTSSANPDKQGMWVIARKVVRLGRLTIGAYDRDFVWSEIPSFFASAEEATEHFRVHGPVSIEEVERLREEKRIADTAVVVKRAE